MAATSFFPALFFFFSTLFLGLAVTAHPVERAGPLVQLSFTKYIINEVFNIVEQDLLRAKFHKGIDILDIFGLSSPAVNRAVSYIASVGVGSPPTYCK